MNNLKAFAVAAVRSGEGKTTLTLGIMAALVSRGIKVQPFKIGPDFIDPSLHKLVTGKESYNLDLRMMGEKCCKNTFSDKSIDAEVSVVEGVMGLFDGNQASTAQTAKHLEIPVILIIDARSCAESSVAILKGFESYDKDLKIAGVIFNKIGSERHKRLIEEELKKKSNVPVIGFVKRDILFEIPERHLGLVTGGEKPLDHNSIFSLAQTVEKSLDLDLLLSKSSVISRYKRRATETRDLCGKPSKRLAVALDEAFSFYYPQNLEMMRIGGFEIINFSPVNDRKLPENIDMIYIGGGYPELHAYSLSTNEQMIDEIRSSFNDGVTIYGECGGFMYLCSELVDLKGNVHNMASIFPFRTVMNNSLRKLGYREATILEDCRLGSKGENVYGHEFHYSHISNKTDYKYNHIISHLYSLDNNSYEGYIVGSAIGSYVHLHFGRTPGIINKIFDITN